MHWNPCEFLIAVIQTTTMGSLLHRFWWTDLMKTGTRRADCTTIYKLYCRPHVTTPVIDQC